MTRETLFTVYLTNGHVHHKVRESTIMLHLLNGTAIERITHHKEGAEL